MQYITATWPQAVLWYFPLPPTMVWISVSPLYPKSYHSLLLGPFLLLMPKDITISVPEISILGLTFLEFSVDCLTQQIGVCALRKWDSPNNACLSNFTCLFLICLLLVRLNHKWSCVFYPGKTDTATNSGRPIFLFCFLFLAIVIS